MCRCVCGCVAGLNRAAGDVCSFLITVERTRTSRRSKETKLKLFAHIGKKREKKSGLWLRKSLLLKICLPKMMLRMNLQI